MRIKRIAPEGELKVKFQPHTSCNMQGLLHVHTRTLCTHYACSRSSARLSFIFVCSSIVVVVRAGGAAAWDELCLTVAKVR